MRPTARIAFRGNFNPRTKDDEPFSTESHVSATMEKMGHEVIRIQEDEVSWPKCAEMAHGADLFWFTSTFGMAMSWDQDEAYRWLDKIKDWMPTVSFHLDLYLGLARQDQVGTTPFWATDYSFTADGDPEHQREFERRGIRHFGIPPAVFEDGCYLAEPKDEYRANVAFVGSWRRYHPEWPYRQQLCKHLMKKWRAAMWPKTNQPAIREHELNRLYASVKVVVGDSCNPGFALKCYMSDRIPETLGRGGFLIHPRIEGLEDLYTDREHLVLYDYRDFKGLDRLIDYYLHHEDERERIRLQGHEHTKAHHTYRDRLEQVFGILHDEGAL